jgi:ABC-type uncharacterized transport system auxiliary subunit
MIDLTHSFPSSPSFRSLPAIRVPDVDDARSAAGVPSLAGVRPVAAPSPQRVSDRAFVVLFFVLLGLIILAGLVGCAGRVPMTRYYDLASPAAHPAAAGPVIALDQLDTDEAYDDERMVYRTSPYRLDYYDYHRWSASPGVMIGNYLERGLERSGLFGSVVRETTRDAAAILSGRVVSIEEIDVSKQAWEGHLVLELRLADARTGDVLWQEQFEEREPLASQSPEGLAKAISDAMERIVGRAAPEIHSRLAEHLASAEK